MRIHRALHQFYPLTATALLATSCFQQDQVAGQTLQDALYQEGHFAGIKAGKEQALAECQEVEVLSDPTFCSQLCPT